MEEASSVDIRENRSVDGSEERTVEERVEEFQALAGGDSVRCNREGGDGLQGERESDSMMVGHSEQGNGECRVSTGHSEDKVELFPGPVGQWRGEECEVRCAEEVDEFR